MKDKLTVGMSTPEEFILEIEENEDGTAIVTCGDRRKENLGKESVEILEHAAKVLNQAARNIKPELTKN